MPRPNVSAARKDQIIQAAMRVFSKNGIEAAGMEEIAAEAHLSIGGVYWYYKSKDEVILAVASWLMEQDRCLMEKMKQSQGTVKERMLLYTAEFLEGVKPYQRILDELYTLIRRNPAVDQLFQEDFSFYRATVVQMIEQGIQRGELKPVNVQTLAVMVMAIYEGMAQLALIDPANIEVGRDLRLTFELLFDSLELTTGEET